MLWQILVTYFQWCPKYSCLFWRFEWCSFYDQSYLHCSMIIFKYQRWCKEANFYYRILFFLFFAYCEFVNIYLTVSFLLDCHVLLDCLFFTWLSHLLLDCHFFLDFLFFMLYSIAWESLSRRLIYYKTTKLLNLINIHLIMCVFHVRVTHVWKLLEIWQKLGRYVKLSVVLILKVWEHLHM